MAGSSDRWWAGDLPMDTMGFAGHEARLATLQRLLTQGPTGGPVTLTGIAGIGKTRLALRVAGALRPRFEHGAWFADLARLRDPALLAGCLIRVFHGQDHGARPAAETLTAHLAHRRALLVLDHCDDFAAECARLLPGLLAAAPGLRVLATAARPLGVPGEHVVEVPPLTTPTAGEPSRAGEPDRKPGSETMEMFTLLGHGPAEPTGGGPALPALAELGRRLGGIPLGVSLAAGRLRSCSADELLPSLAAHVPPPPPTGGPSGDASGDTSGGGADGAAGTVPAGTVPGGSVPTDTVPDGSVPGGSVPGHADRLRAILDWAYERCDPDERLLWARLSVFAPGFDAAAAEHACTESRLRQVQIGPILDRLVSASIVERLDDSEGTRYRLPRAVADYGRERLRALGEETTLLQRHRDFYLRRVRDGEEAWPGGRQVAWYRCLNRDLPNIRAAVAFCLHRPAEHLAGLILVSSLWYFWSSANLFREGRHYLDLLLRVVTAPSAARTKALWVCGGLAAMQGDFAYASRRAAECVTRAEAERDATAAAYGTQVAGTVALLDGDAALAISRLSKAIGRHRARGELSPGLMLGLPQLAAAYGAVGQTAGARALLTECASVCDERGELWARGHTLFVLGRVAYADGDIDEAWTHVRLSLRIKRLFDDVPGMARCLELLAWVAAGQGNAERAARLLGAAVEIGGVPGQSRSPGLSERHRCERRVRESLGDATYESVAAEGARLAISDAIAYALGEEFPV